MINYIEKGYGIHKWLADHGVSIREVDGVLVSNVPDDQVNQLISDYNPWSDEKAAKLAEINTDFENAVSALTAGTTEAERNSWAIQEREAKEYPQKTPVALTILANSRGIPLEALVEKVLQKSEMYQQAYFTLQGTRDKLEDLVKLFPSYGEYHRLSELVNIKFEV